MPGQIVYDVLPYHCILVISLEAAMKEITTTLTQRGQVTVPVEVQRILGVKPRDKVTFTIEDGHVTLSAPAFTLESAFGSVTPSQRPEDFKKLIREAKEAKAEETLRKMRS